MVSGVPGWLSRLSFRLPLRSWSHGLWVRAPCPLCADSSEPGACFGFCVSLSLCPSPIRALSLSAFQKWIKWKSPVVKITLKNSLRGAWVAQSVERPTSARVMISRFVSSSPVSGSGLMAWSLLPILCLPLSLPLPHSCSVSLCLKNKHLKKIFF